MRSGTRLLKALADPQRIRILMLLRNGELCVCQIVEVLGLAPSTVSKHLALLDAADVVQSRKRGRWVLYRAPENDRAPLRRNLIKNLRSALAEDIDIQRDADRLRNVLALDPEILCRRQRGES